MEPASVAASAFANRRSAVTSRAFSRSGQCEVHGVVHGAVMGERQPQAIRAKRLVGVPGDRHPRKGLHPGSCVTEFQLPLKNLAPEGAAYFRRQETGAVNLLGSVRQPGGALRILFLHEPLDGDARVHHQVHQQPVGKTPRSVPSGVARRTRRFVPRGAFSPRCDGTHRFAIRAIVFFGEGKPLPKSPSPAALRAADEHRPACVID